MQYKKELLELRGAIVEWLEALVYGAQSPWKVVSSNLGFTFQQLENWFCQLCSRWLPASKLGKDKAATGEEWALSCCAQDIVSL